jgi:hypothetical protein
VVGNVGACCLLLFTSTLQGWDLAFAVGSGFFLLCGVQVLHPQFDLHFCRSSFRSKFRCHNLIFYSFFVVQCLQFASKNVCLFLLACSSYVFGSFCASATV